MKKISATMIACLSLFCLSAGAQTKQENLSSCPFTDSFHLNGANAAITSLTADGNLAVQKVDASNFNASCADNESTDNGNVYLVVVGNVGACKLTISDGPFMWDPVVNSVNCSGTFQFNGMTHNSGTYLYTLNFVTKK